VVGGDETYKKPEPSLATSILTGIGPLLLPFLIALLILFLVTGFALLYLPHLEAEFKVGADGQTGSLLEAVYFSGITLLTVGFGDIVPLSGATRLLVLLEGASGISVISLGVTYLLTVYGALERKRAVALAFYHQARQGADVASFIAVHFARGQFFDLTDDLKTATRDLQEMLEAHLEHPVIHYFHPLEVYKGLPRVLFVMLETVTILRSCLDREEYVEAGEHPSITIAESTVSFVLNELLTALNLEKKTGREFESETEESARRKRCFQPRDAPIETIGNQTSRRPGSRLSPIIRRGASSGKRNFTGSPIFWATIGKK
jgi:voltage-gated potassium channel Kch